MVNVLVYFLPVFSVCSLKRVCSGVLDLTLVLRMGGLTEENILLSVLKQRRLCRLHVLPFLADDSVSFSLHCILPLPPLNAELWFCDPTLGLYSISGPHIMYLISISEPCHFKSIHRTSLTLKPSSWARSCLYHTFAPLVSTFAWH